MGVSIVFGSGIKEFESEVVLYGHNDFISGMPGETKETAEQTIRFVKEIKPNVVQFSVATPLPGTEFHSYVKENGFLLVDDLEESLDKDGFQKCSI